MHCPNKLDLKTKTQSVFPGIVYTYRDILDSSGSNDLLIHLGLLLRLWNLNLLHLSLTCLYCCLLWSLNLNHLRLCYLENNNQIVLDICIKLQITRKINIYLLVNKIHIMLKSTNIHLNNLRSYHF